MKKHTTSPRWPTERSHHRSSHRFAATAALLMCVALGVTSCKPSPVSGSLESSAVAEPPEEEIELATLMGDMQRYSSKLGFAIQGENQPLANFYLEELLEVLEVLEAIVEHDGMPIGSPAKVILDPALSELTAQLEPVHWGEAWRAYEAAIEACNRCHLATEHGFIQILPAHGTPPFNQAFAVPGAAQPDS